MGSEKVTMVVKVNLECCKWFKKVKKILCKIPEIQDQQYDEKKGTVTIKVVSSNPEKIKQKIICKGDCSITGVEIKKDPPKPPTDEGKKKEQDPPKPPTDEGKKKDPPPPVQSIAIGVCCQQQSFCGYPGGGSCDGNCRRHCGGGGCGPPPCGQCDGNCGRRCGGGGRCDGNCGRCCGTGDGRNCCVNRCNTYWCEENPKGCATM